MNKNKFKNGGFPPLRYCPQTNEKQPSKERLYITYPSTKFTISPLFNSNNSNDLIDNSQINRDSDFDIINNL
jgi:hypothetical protein